jgi:hypothetical protein
MTFFHLGINGEILAFMIAFLEGIRRIQWNVFRLENEARLSNHFIIGPNPDFPFTILALEQLWTVPSHKRDSFTVCRRSRAS